MKSPSKTFSTFVHLNCLDKLSRKLKWHISVSRVKNSSTSVKKLFCAVAAIKGSTGPATVEYHEKPTRDAVRSGEDIPSKCEFCSSSRAILPNFESTRNEGN